MYFSFEKYLRRSIEQKISLHSVSPFVIKKGEKAFSCDWHISFQESIIEKDNFASERDLSG